MFLPGKPGVIVDLQLPAEGTVGLILNHHPVVLDGAGFRRNGVCPGAMDEGACRKIDPCPAAEPTDISVEWGVVKFAFVVESKDPDGYQVFLVRNQERSDIQLHRPAVMGDMHYSPVDPDLSPGIQRLDVETGVFEITGSDDSAQVEIFSAFFLTAM